MADLAMLVRGVTCPHSYHRRIYQTMGVSAIDKGRKTRATVGRELEWEEVHTIHSARCTVLVLTHAGAHHSPPPIHCDVSFSYPSWISFVITLPSGRVIITSTGIPMHTKKLHCQDPSLEVHEDQTPNDRASPAAGRPGSQHRCHFSALPTLTLDYTYWPHPAPLASVAVRK